MSLFPQVVQSSAATSSGIIQRIADLQRQVKTLQATKTVIGESSIGTGMIVSGSITTALIQAGAITAELIQAGAIDATHIQALAIQTGHLQAGSVTTPKLDAGAVTADKLSVATLSAVSADLGSVTSGSITGGTIRTAANGTRVELSSAEGLKGYKAGTPDEVKFHFDPTTGILQASAVITAEAGSVIPAPYITGEIVETQIDDNSISTPKLQANSVTAAKITVSELSAISADLGSITAGTVTGALIQTAASGARAAIEGGVGFYGHNGTDKSIQVSDADGTVTLAASIAALIPLVTPTLTNPSAATNTTGWSSPSGTITRDTVVYDSSPASIKYVRGGLGANYLLTATTTGTFLAGHTYRLTFQLYWEDGGGLGDFSATFGTFSTDYSRVSTRPAAQDAWETYTLEWTPTADRSNATFRFQPDMLHPVNSTWYLDTFNVYDLTPPESKKLRFADTVPSGPIRGSISVGALQGTNNVVMDITAFHTSAATQESSSALLLKASDAPFASAAVYLKDKPTLGSKKREVFVSVANDARTDVHAKSLLLSDGSSDFQQMANPRVMLTKSASQSISNAAWNKITWDGTEYDANYTNEGAGASAHFDNTNDRIVCRKAGLYHVHGWISYANNVTGARYLGLFLNGAFHSRGYIIGAGGGVGVGAGYSRPIELAVGDYLEMHAYQSSGGALASGSGSDASFGMYRVGS